MCEPSDGGRGFDPQQPTTPGRAGGPEEESSAPPSIMDAGDLVDPLRYDPIDNGGEPLPVGFAAVGFTDEQATALAVNIAEDLVDKVDAGARLFFALYHHPSIVRLVGSEYWTKGLNKAYMAGSAAFLGRSRL